MYDLVLGDGLQATRGAYLLGLLGHPPVARYRDAWVERGVVGPVIVVYTRQGGPYRTCRCAEDGACDPAECWAASTRAMRGHLLYLSDADDVRDPTYAAFRFGPPPEHAAMLAGDAIEPVDTSARWQAAYDRITGGNLRAEEFAMGGRLAALLGLLPAEG